MNDLEFIENYVNGQLSADERARFETALRTDPAVADALAFYMLAKHTAKIDAHEQRKAEFDALRKKSYVSGEVIAGADDVPVVKPLWSVPMRWAAAASVVLILGLGWYFLRGTTGTDATRTLAANATEQTDAYITDHFNQLSTTMSGQTDSLKQGVGLYNEQKFAEAETIFQDILKRQPDNDRALNYAGIVALRQGNYDQAIDRFHRLSERTDLFANPGTFYEALAYLKRGQPMDKERAQNLLHTVISKNLEGKNEAAQLLKSE
jgi:tetratricopeptide (TPR) repeat protein